MISIMRTSLVLLLVASFATTIAIPSILFELSAASSIEDINEPAQEVEYKITVITKTRSNAGTADLVTVQLGNERLWTDVEVLGSFDSGETKKISFITNDIGDVKFLRFQIDGKDAWLHKSTTVEMGGKKFTFPGIGTYLKCRRTGCSMEITAGSLDAGNGNACRTCKHTGKAAPALTSNWASLVTRNRRVVERNFAGPFTTWVDCGRRGPVRFEYIARDDCGCENRVHSFYVDTQVPRSCQATTASSMGPAYDRGHMVAANHFDFDKLAIKETNFISNILPQHLGVNRGAWLLSEEVIECLREREPLRVVGGAVWPASAEEPEDTLLAASHGIPLLPRAFWKVVRASTLYPEDNGLMAWWMPNSALGGRRNIDRFVVSIAELEARLAAHQTVSDKSTDGQFHGVAEVFEGLTDAERSHRPARSWPVPKGCNKQ